RDRRGKWLEDLRRQRGADRIPARALASAVRHHPIHNPPGLHAAKGTSDPERQKSGCKAYAAAKQKNRQSGLANHQPGAVQRETPYRKGPGNRFGGYLASKPSLRFGGIGRRGEWALHRYHPL